MSSCLSFFKECNAAKLDAEKFTKSEKIKQWKIYASEKVKSHIVKLMEDHLENTEIDIRSLDDPVISLQMK